jgi:hypothetical protein
VEHPTLRQILNLSFALELEHSFVLEPTFQDHWQALKAQLPDPTLGELSLQTWWQTLGLGWVQAFRTLIREHRDFELDWQWSPQHQVQLQQYYLAHQLLVDCLNGDSRVTPARHTQIMNTLFRPLGLPPAGDSVPGGSAPTRREPTVTYRQPKLNGDSL